MTIPFEQIPGPQMPKNLFGQINSVRAFSDNLIKSFREAFAEHGDVVAMQPLGEKMVLFRHPDHIHEALVTKSKSLKKSREYTDPKRGLARFVGTGMTDSVSSLGETVSTDTLRTGSGACRVSTDCVVTRSLVAHRGSGWPPG